MKLGLVVVSGSRPKWLDLAIQEYSEKINHHLFFDVYEIKSGGQARDDREAKVKSESQAILDFLKPKDFVVLLDEKGSQLDSVQFSEKLNRILLSGKKRAFFIIGGAYGVSKEVKDRADLKLSLSGFVLNHHVAQVVATEQIYRGLSILKNLPYHNI